VKSRLLNFLFWLVIAAAFIGPGTVTTAASAGANFGYQLIWALVFSTFACAILQEAAARVVIGSGKTLSQAIKEQYSSKTLILTIVVSVFLGCVAYEAGNILGAISGLALIVTSIPVWVFTVVIVLISALILFLDRISSVANFLGLLVAVMGFSFIAVAIQSKPVLSDIFIGAFMPSLNTDSVLLTLGLVGTTIVPYNIFLGAGLAKGQSIKQMRAGLIPSVILGGIISIAVVIVGSGLESEFSFEALYTYLSLNQGSNMARFFAVGLFAAGFTSTITAALAGAFALRSGFYTEEAQHTRDWSLMKWWLLVLFVGLVFGVSGVKPIPVIILAQAANGFILPLIAFALWQILNNSNLVNHHINSYFQNVSMAITVGVTSMLGLINVSKALYTVFGLAFALDGAVVYSITGLTLLILFYAIWNIRKLRINN